MNDETVQAITEKIQEALAGYDDAPDVTVEPGFAGNLHVTVVSPVFEGWSGKQRNHLVWPKLRDLPPHILLRLTLCLLLTPGEAEALVPEPAILV
jgi:hypothetical protein